MLLHELICHAFAARHPRQPPSLEFGEGWMAAVAHDVLLAMTEAATPFSDLGLRLDDAVGTRRAASTLHLARLRQGDDGRGFGARVVGNDVATHMRDHIRAQRLHHGDERQMFWRLSHALSSSALPAPVLDRFCTRVNLVVERGSQADRLHRPLARRIERLDAAPTAAGDAGAAAEQLVEEVLAN